MSEQPPTDWIQSAVVARATELGLTAYAIAQLAENAVSEDAVKSYLTGRKSLTSAKLQHVLRVLGLSLKVKK